MKKLASFLLKLALVLCYSGAYAQMATVTGTVIDTDSQAWVSGSWRAALSLPSGQFSGTTPTISGVPQTTTASGTMNANGVFSANLVRTDLLDQSGGQWTITVCPNVSVGQYPNGCYSVALSVTSSGDVSSRFSGVPAPRIPAGSGQFAYNDTEILTPPQPGSQYFNVGPSTGMNGMRFWDGHVWASAAGASNWIYRGTWSSTTTYAQSDVVVFSGIGYLSSVANNLNNTPNTSPSQWSSIGTVAVPTVAKSGDTMTGPLVLPADPTANLQAATKQYVDTHTSGATTGTNLAVAAFTGTVNGPNATLSQLSGVATDAAYHDVKVTSGNLEGKITNGVTHTKYTNGVQAALDAGLCASGCTLETDPNATAGTGNFVGNAAMPNNVEIRNNSNAYYYRFLHNWADSKSSANTGQISGDYDVVRLDKLQNEPANYSNSAGLNLIPKREELHLDFPGFNFGYHSGTDPQYNVSAVNYRQMDALIHTQGIFNYLTMNLAKLGSGDFTGISKYVSCSWINWDPSAEGCVPDRVQISDAGVWNGTLNANLDTTTFRMSTGGGGDQGLGVNRIVVNTVSAKTQPVTIASITTAGQNGLGLATLSTTLPAVALPAGYVGRGCYVTSADTTLTGANTQIADGNTENTRVAADIVIPSTTGVLVGDGFTVIDTMSHIAVLHYPDTSKVTAAVALTSGGVWNGTTTYAANTIVQESTTYYRSYAAGNLNHDPATSPTYWQSMGTNSAGTLITANLSYAHLAGATICIGGIAGGGFLTNDRITNRSNPWPFTIVGATDSTHIYVASPRQGSLDAYGMTGPATIYTGSRILDTRDPAVSYTTGDHVKLADFVPVNAWVSGDTVAEYNDPLGAFIGQRINIAINNPFTQGSGTEYDYGFAGGIGNGGGGFDIIRIQGPSTNTRYQAHTDTDSAAGPYLPPNVIHNIGITPIGSLYYGLAPEAGTGAIGSLLSITDFASGNNVQKYYIWNHQTTGSSIEYDQNSGSADNQVSINAPKISLTSTVSTYLGGDVSTAIGKNLNVGAVNSTFGDTTHNVNSVHVGGYYVGEVTLDEMQGVNNTRTHTFGRIAGYYDTGDARYVTGLYAGSAAGTVDSTVLAVAAKYDRLTFFGASCTGQAANDVCFGTTGNAKVNATSGVAAFAAGSTIGGKNICLADGTNCGLASGTPTFAIGTGVTSVACATGYTCTNQRGELTLVGGTATTGTIATVTFSAALSAAPFCTVTLNGNGSPATYFALGHGTPSTTAFTLTAGVSVSGATLQIDYDCRQ